MKTTSFNVQIFCLLFLLVNNSCNSNDSSSKNAYWITHLTENPEAFGVYLFRKSFHLEQKPELFPIKITADSRYALFVNGTEVISGPAKSDLQNWMYDSLNISTHLKEGENLLAVEVYHYGPSDKPVALISDKVGLWIKGTTALSSIINSDTSYTVLKNEGIEQVTMPWREWGHGWYAVGPTDKINGEKYPWNWQKKEFNANHWLKAKAYPDSSVKWQLKPRNIPFLTNEKERLKEIRQIKGIANIDNFFIGKQAIIPPQSNVSVILDQGYLTAGFPELIVSQGKGSNIRLTYAEAPFVEKGKRTKFNRDSIEGKVFVGCYDLFKPDGGELRAFKPHWWRTFRYVQLDIETGKDSLIIHDYYNHYTTYPFELKATFESNDASLKSIWETGWRTARLCSFDTYMDCPYYEQLNYVGDTRIQAYISLFADGDDRLMRNAIQHFYHSILHNNLTLACYPSDTSKNKIIIPTYSLFYISMLHDYWMHRNDDEFILSKLTSSENILEWYSSQIDQTGLIKDPEYWNFTDWAFEKRGVPPGAVEIEGGHSAFLSLQLAKTMTEYAELLDYFNRIDKAEKWRQQAEEIKHSVFEQCYVNEKELFADTPQKLKYSQHTNIYAILTDAIPYVEQKKLMDRILINENLTQTTLYFKFYLFEALKKTKLGHHFFNELVHWKHMLENGLTTFSETENIHNVRSECHAWSASPVYELLSLVAGVSSTSPGFESVQIAPCFGDLKYIRAKVPHPEGEIQIDLVKKDGTLTGKVFLPKGITGELIWNGKSLSLIGNNQNVVI